MSINRSYTVRLTDSTVLAAIPRKLQNDFLATEYPAADVAHPMLIFFAIVVIQP